MLWLMLFTIIHTAANFDSKTCSFLPGFDVGTGVFMLQFWLFVLAIDMQGLVVRIYLFKIMNKKHHSEIVTFEEKREKNFLDSISGDTPENSKSRELTQS